MLRLSRASKAKDKWQDVGASAAPSQGNFLLSSNNSSSKKDAKSQVLVKALDLADLVSLVTSRIKEQQKGGKLLMKLDVEGTEYTLLPHLALKKHLCSIDLLFIEWHERYFTGVTRSASSTHSIYQKASPAKGPSPGSQTACQTPSSARWRRAAPIAQK